MKLRKSNGDYTMDGLKYPGMKADIALCYKFLSELCAITWAGSDSYFPKMIMWSIPPTPENFDMQLSAAFDELEAYRATVLTPEEVAELAQAKREGRLVVLPFYAHDTVYYAFPSVKKVIMRTVGGYVIENNLAHIVDLNGARIALVDSVGETVFLTRTEAEAALSAQEGGNADD